MSESDEEEVPPKTSAAVDAQPATAVPTIDPSTAAPVAAPFPPASIAAQFDALWDQKPFETSSFWQTTTASSQDTYCPVSADEVTASHEEALPGLDCLQDLPFDRSLLDLVNKGILTPGLMPEETEAPAAEQDEPVSLPWTRRLAGWLGAKLTKYANKDSTPIHRVAPGEEVAFVVSAITQHCH